MRRAFIFAALFILGSDVKAFDLRSWNGEFYAALSGKGRRAGSKLKPGYQALSITQTSETGCMTLKLVTPEGVTLSACVGSQEMGKYVADASWEKAAQEPSLNEKVGYFDPAGKLVLGEVSAYVLRLASFEGDAWPELVPVVDGRTDAPLLLDGEVLEGYAGETRTFSLKPSTALAKLVMTHKVAEFMAVRRVDEDFNCGSGWGTTGEECVHEIVGCPVHDWQTIQALLTEFGMEQNYYPWSWYGDSDFGFVTGPSADEPAYGYMITFFLTKGQVSWIWGHRAYPEILSIGEKKFLRVGGCKPSSDGCDAYVTEWAVDPYENRRKPKKILQIP